MVVYCYTVCVDLLMHSTMCVLPGNSTVQGFGVFCALPVEILAGQQGWGGLHPPHACLNTENPCVTIPKCVFYADTILD